MAVETRTLAAETGDHFAQFYEDEAELAGTAGRYLSDAVRAGAIALVIATEAHRSAFAAELEAAGLHPASQCRDGRLICLDAAATMASFMPDGQIDRDQFREVVGSVVRQAGATGRPVRAYGEMVALLWDGGDVLAAIELEKLWNELGRELRFSLMCAYRSTGAQEDEHSEALREICTLHSAVIPPPRPALDESRDSTGAAVSARFLADRDAPRSARRFVANALVRWGHAGMLLDDARLVITELATNAVVHARSPFSVVARAEGSRIHLSVCDASLVKPTLIEEDPMATSGRGLRLVSLLSYRWGVDVAAHGKTVWAELQL
ncbi:MAG: MEDS domain-containing protein [Solirubrobacteraceae bacterium]